MSETTNDRLKWPKLIFHFIAMNLNAATKKSPPIEWIIASILIPSLVGGILYAMQYIGQFWLQISTSVAIVFLGLTVNSFRHQFKKINAKYRL